MDKYGYTKETTGALARFIVVYDSSATGFPYRVVDMEDCTVLNGYGALETARAVAKRSNEAGKYIGTH